MESVYTIELSFVLVAILAIVCVSRPSQHIARAVVCILCAAMQIIYFSWRFGQMKYYFVHFDVGSAWACFFTFAEVLCGAEYLLFFVMMSRTRDNTGLADTLEAKLKRVDPDSRPMVDVWIATYDEEWAILEKTIVGAVAIDYPRDRLNIYVLDDGRREWLREKCAEFGITHLTRSSNKGKKAGNHNNALRATDAPYILSLDADFVPFRNIVNRLVGFFDDEKLAVVQTPQTYYNSDIMNQSLRLGHAPDELAYFYREIQPSRDAWGAAFYCGSCAMLRRSAVEAIGGFVTETDIEDQATSVKLLANGFKTRFLNETLSVGLSAESHSVFHDQRNRWCRGSLQILFMPFGPFGRGLNLMQRLLFLQTYWLSVGLPLIAYLTPPLICVFGWDIFPKARLEDVLLIPLLMMVSTFMALVWLTRLHWVPIYSTAVQLFVAIELTPTVITSLIKPFGKPLIKILPVTPKGRMASTQRVDILTFLILLGFVLGLVGCFAYGASHDIRPPRHPRAMLAIAFWTIYELVIFAIAMLMCFETSERPTEVKFKVKQRVSLALPDGRLVPAMAHELALDAARVRLEEGHGLADGDAIVMTIPTIGAIAATIEVGGEGQEFDVRFDEVDTQTRRALIVALFTDWKVHYVRPQFKAIPIYKEIFMRYVGAAT